MAERVLITGARAVAALDIARSLRAAGWEPHLADCSPALMARWSNSAGPVHRYASPVRRPAAFAADVAGLVERLKPAAVIPTCEEVFHLAAVAERAGFADRLFAPGIETLAALHAKDRFAALCGDLGLPVPATRTAADRRELIAAAEAVGDAVLKPVWSRFGARTRLASEGLEGVEPSASDPWVVQRRVAGEDVSFYAVCHGGRVSAFAAYGSDWRAAGGAALAFRPLPYGLARTLRRMAERLAAHVGTGQLSCDAVVDADGAPWLIECNPRATSGVHLFGRSGAFGRALLGRGETEPVDGPRHIGPAAWRDWPRARRDLGADVISAPGDPWPVAGALADAAAFGLRALREGRTLREAMTADIEWNGAPFAADVSGWEPHLKNRETLPSQDSRHIFGADGQDWKNTVSTV